MLGTPPNAGVQMSSILVTPTTPTPTSVKPSSNFQTYEGQLNKFTNVVKGWQYRWFVLTPETGNLEYYLMDEGIIGKRRGRQHVAGTVVVPSDEDSQTFQVNFASGESYKLRAANVKDRQVWVDRIRAVAHRHESAMARDHAPPIVHKEYMGPPPGAKSLLSSNGEPSAQLQHLSLSVLDAFGSVHDILQQTDLKHASLTKSIETLSLPKCHDTELLMLKATSQAALQSMESSLNILQDLRDLQVNTVIAHHKHKSVSPLALSPKKGAGIFGMSNSSHVDLPPSYSPNLSASLSPTKMHEAFGDFTKNSSGGGDTLSVKSAAVLDHPSHYSEHTSAGDLASANLSASNPNLDQAGQKAS